MFSTYSTLKEAYENQRNQMYEAILSARSNTERLVDEMKTLYHGIRNYLRKIQGQSDVNTLLRDHFEGYKALADRVYHPIKTMDSVYRYMAPILEILGKVLADHELLESMRERAMSVRRYETEEEAGLEIINAIDFVTEKYQSIGGIVNEIDRKHTNYTKLSIDAIRYHMTADQSIRGKLAILLKGYAAAPAGRQEYMLGLMERGVCVNRQEFFDMSSLWHRSVRARRTSDEPLSIDSAEAMSVEESKSLLSYLSDAYSLSKIRAYMDRLFGEKDSVATAEIDIGGDSEFIMLLLAAIRAGEKNAGFKARIGDESLDVNGYKIPEIVFTRKGNEHVGRSL